MATKPLVSIEEYCKTSYSPDLDFLDGELQERNVGTFEHARLQALLAIVFDRHRRDWNLLSLTECRLQVAEERFRIPDVTVTSRGRQPSVIVQAPLIVIEVLSPDDTYGDMRNRAADYTRMGVPHIWLVDPGTRTGQVFKEGLWNYVAEFVVPDTPIRIGLAELFAEYDEF